jgi:tetratricopeptide (TPR) repeat protein
MDKSRKLDFLQAKKLGPLDDLREELSRLEEVHLAIKVMDSEQALKLLHDLDQVIATFEKLDPTGERLVGEWSRFESVQGRLKQHASKLLKLIGGEEALAQQRPRPAPPADHWWWYLDQIVAERQRGIVKRVGIISFIVLVILGTVVVLFNTVFKPSPEAVARLNAVNDAYTAIELDGDFEKALAIIDEGLAVVPNDPSMLMVKGVVLQLLGRESEAEDMFLLVQGILNNPIEYHLSRAQVYLRTNQLAQAESDALAALELNDESAWGWMLLGQSYEMQESYIDALDAYEIAGEIAFENEENELYVMSRLAVARITETLPAVSVGEGTVEPTAEPTGE